MRVSCRPASAAPAAAHLQAQAAGGGGGACGGRRVHRGLQVSGLTASCKLGWVDGCRGSAILSTCQLHVSAALVSCSPTRGACTVVAAAGACFKRRPTWPASLVSEGPARRQPAARWHHGWQGGRVAGWQGGRVAGWATNKAGRCGIGQGSCRRLRQGVLRTLPCSLGACLHQCQEQGPQGPVAA